VRLESWRHKAIILGEDLGTLPEGFQERLSGSGLSGMKVLWFEREHVRFTSPAHWPRADVAMTSTHDLATVAGWWAGRDVAWRERLGLGDIAAEQAEREGERAALWQAIQHSSDRTDPAPAPGDVDAIADAVCTHIGTAACDLVLLPIEDALAMQEQPNLPNTVDEHPNWRRRLPDTVDSMLGQPRVSARLEALAKARK
jgi:4-alpha-glucanotransferase